MTDSNDRDQTEQRVEDFRTKIGRLREEVGKVIVGHRDVIDGVMTCMLAGSHALLEGVPGLGKTILVRTLAESLSLHFSRIQFTPDLMPADIIGTTVIDESSSGAKVFEFRRGPVFANIVLADEINRATPKTQSALLEAMQEQRVTVAKTTHKLDLPFFVLATQNPLEMEGTYPLPEAQLDRFFLKLQVSFPDREQLHAIVDRTTGSHMPTVEPVLDGQAILQLQQLVREVPVARHVQDYAIRLLQACHPDGDEAPDMVRRFVRFGPSPRGAQATLLAAKIRALFEGRFAASTDDVKAVALPALRHRVLLNFEGEAEGVRPDQVLEHIIKKLPESKA
ncbi:MAG TPA: MoxR family ATPase [Polyangiaceae bacterium]|jgi:MoxR-like ATPase|nr:MAG: Holliday junction DNA helicase RuvB [Deltaproteobacteria bacterium ADurb.Bin207]HNS97199.1 MoxR family ATPase [Polyangiaceae bacterium]HNZ21294.1 MoxR family ATPase [Polyangiaceae bacterium]HOD21021.1 MoxR family ATPase [Polyangiaceae bacterium]HOE48681.1 MoxR family ATPase [Polyangiaceae bacterium]